MKQLSSQKIDQINRKSTGLLVIVIGMILIFAVAMLAKFADLSIISDKLDFIKNVKGNRDTITVKGTVGCLPPKSGKATNKSCELGLKADDGKYYAIQAMNNPLELYSEVGSSTTEITGELIEAGADEKYDIVGTIVP